MLDAIGSVSDGRRAAVPFECGEYSGQKDSAPHAEVKNTDRIFAQLELRSVASVSAPKDFLKLAEV